MSLTSFGEKLMLCKGADIDAIDKLSREYSAILQKYSINHESIDYKQLQCERPEDFEWNDDLTNLNYRLQVFVAHNLANAILATITAALIWVVFGFALPSAEVPKP